MENVLTRLKIALKNSGKKLKDVSNDTGIPYLSAGKIFRAEVDPGVSKIEKIANYLDINFNWLFTGRGPIFNTNKENENAYLQSGPLAALVNENNQSFNHRQTSEFTELALNIIREEQITQEELVAAVLEVRRRRKQGLSLPLPASPVPVKKLKDVKK